MSKNILIITVIILSLGFFYRIFLTSGGKFIFNMDNARDYVDVREMVELKKPRLTGPTSAIEGVYTGPGWYLLLAIPYILGDGHPYAGVLAMIILWAVGGFFLLRLLTPYGKAAMIFAGLIWAFSNYLLLATSYTFNPNPVTLLAPLFIYLLEKYLNTGSSKFAILAGLLGGLFFNFEMNAGVFMPLIIVAAIFILKKYSLLREKAFYLGVAAFAITLLPQALFDFRHDFIMTNSLLKYLTQETDPYVVRDPIRRVSLILNTFYNIATPTFLNARILLNGVLIAGCILAIALIKKPKKTFNIDTSSLIALLMILIPYVGYVFLPVTVNPWHIGAPMSAAIFLSGVVVGKLINTRFWGKVLAFGLFIVLAMPVISSLSDSIKNRNQEILDPSVFRNELAAVDYAYQQADGDNFKAYSYLPSVIDYPYQYIFWWRGTKKYGYTPTDYSYLFGKPLYISNKEKFVSPNTEAKNSDLVILIKEPDRVSLRGAWEDNFKMLPLQSTQKFGLIEVEVRKESTSEAKIK